MALGTLDRTPPPFFRQGPSALTKLSFCSALALFLMVADARFTLTQSVRATVATMLYPLQRTLLVPVEVLAGGRDYVTGLSRALAAEQAARSDLTRQAERALRADHLAQENTRLRALLELRPTLNVRSQAAELLYEAADPYSRKVIIDRGVTPGTLTLGTDNGTAFTSRAFRAHLAEHAITHRRGGYRDPESQAFIESWFSKLKLRCVWRE